MTFPLWFVYWVLCFLAVIAGLSVLCALREWWLWRQDQPPAATTANGKVPTRQFGNGTDR